MLIPGLSPGTAPTRPEVRMYLDLLGNGLMSIEEDPTGYAELMYDNPIALCLFDCINILVRVANSPNPTSTPRMCRMRLEDNTHKNNGTAHANYRVVQGSSYKSMLSACLSLGKNSSLDGAQDLARMFRVRPFQAPSWPEKPWFYKHVDQFVSSISRVQLFGFWSNGNSTLTQPSIDCVAATPRH